MPEEYEDIFGETSVTGGYARVRQVKRKSDGKVLARKQIQYSALKYASEKEFREKVEKEVALMRRLEHPNIVQYYDFREVSSTQFNIYMEFCEGKNLEDYVSHKKTQPDWPSQREVWSVVYQLSAAIAYCHFGLYRLQSGATLVEKTDKVGLLRSQVLHRDVKPRNVLLRPSGPDQLIIKLCDFGLGVSRYPEDVNEMSYGGTSGYIAPEITRDYPQWSTKADVFSLGCTFYYLMMHELPWQYQLTNSSFQPASTLSNRYESALRDLVMGCIEKLPAKRPEADAMFQSAVEYVNKADIILASLRTSSTTLAPNQQIQLSTLTAASTGNLSTTPRTLEPLDLPLRPSSTPADPSLPTVNNDFARPPEPSHANLSNAQTFRPSPALPISAGSTPLLLSDHSSPWRQSIASKNIDDQLKRGLGSFVVDFKRYPPLDALPSPVDVSTQISIHNLTDRIALEYKVHQDNSTQKRSALKFFRSSWPRQTNLRGAIDAKASFEYLLDNSEDHVRLVMRLSGESSRWLVRKFEQKQDCYVVVGYITYIDADISEERNEGRNDGISAPQMLMNGAIGSGVSLSAFESGRSGTKIEKIGENIQAVHVRKIRLRPGVQARHLPTTGFDRLENPFTWYFWGPNRRPIE